VGGADVVLASAGLAHPRMLVSAGALIELDDDELAAGLAHEQGHIARRHRFLLLFAEICRGLGRFLPGTRAACRAVIFHLERDADRWALAQRHEPLVLARAICKAESAFGIGPVYAGLDGGCVPERVEQLVRRSPTEEPRAISIRALATGMAILTLGLTAWAPGTAAAGLATLAEDHPARHCEH
jgi:beta-lactamase regulating signal transducer with metallopeptidase domain